MVAGMHLAFLNMYCHKSIEMIFYLAHCFVVTKETGRNKLLQRAKVNKGYKLESNYNILFIVKGAQSLLEQYYQVLPSQNYLSLHCKHIHIQKHTKCSTSVGNLHHTCYQANIRNLFAMLAPV